MSFAIEVKHITKVYPIYKKKIERLKEALSASRKKYHTDYYALNDVNLEIKEGECVGFIGVNGSGKSTLLKVLTGVLTPTTGDFTVNGKVSALLELGAGFNPEYTGIENIYLNGQVMGFTKEEMDQRLADILKFADIGDFIYQPVKIYSSGMYVRLAFSVAINVDPDILIVDEALSVGDAFFQQKCFNKINAFKQSGKTILLVTHDLGSITRYCDRAYILNKGNLEGEGAPKEIVDQYKKYLSGVDNENNNATLHQVDNEKSMKDALPINPNYLTYGNKKAEIIDYGILDHKGNITTTIIKGMRCKFLIKVYFNETIESPIFAYSIKDEKGNEITGTNTLLESIDIGVCEANNTYMICFEQDFCLQNGTYFISYGCTKYNIESELEVFHRIYDVFHINIVATKNSTGVFDMNSTITVCEIG